MHRTRIFLFVASISAFSSLNHVQNPSIKIKCASWITNAEAHLITWSRSLVLASTSASVWTVSHIPQQRLNCVYENENEAGQLKPLCPLLQRQHSAICLTLNAKVVAKTTAGEPRVSVSQQFTRTPKRVCWAKIASPLKAVWPVKHIFKGRDAVGSGCV